MRRWLPDSLAAWALLILIGGLGVAELATLGAIIQHRAVTARMTGFFHLAERVSSLSRAIAAEPPDQRGALAEALSAPTLEVRVEPKPSATSIAPDDEEVAEIEDIMQARLAGTGIVEVDVGRASAADRPPGDEPDEQAPATGPVGRFLSDIEELYAENDVYLVSAKLAEDSWINFAIPAAPLPRLWSTDTVILTAFVIAAVLGASIWAIRRLTMPYAVLANAAERFGRDRNTVQLLESGPREVRVAAHAFNLMQERLQRFLSDRDQLVAAVSHDLRTPVTRLRLRAEFVEDLDLRMRMLADLEDIESMTQSVLAFTRDVANPQPREQVDLISLLDSLCSDQPGVTLSLPSSLPPRIACHADPVALRRCIANLIDNAVRYGGCARVTLDLADNAARVVVDDDGPGIAEADREQVFRPFLRLEVSRNRETGGTGLGLTIARTVARAHGGDILLSNRAEGGLRAELVLPLAPAGAPKAGESIATSIDFGTSMPRPAA